MEWINMGPLPVYVAITGDEKRFRAYVKKIGFGDTPFALVGGANATRFINDDGQDLIIITHNFSSDATLAQRAASFAHEATHAMQFIQESMYGNNGEAGALDIETQAYIVQYITQECIGA